MTDEMLLTVSAAQSCADRGYSAYIDLIYEIHACFNHLHAKLLMCM